MGWKGRINDPDLDGSFTSTRVATGAGDCCRHQPAGLPPREFLDMITPQFIGDLWQGVPSARHRKAGASRTRFGSRARSASRTAPTVSEDRDRRGAQAAHPHHFWQYEAGAAAPIATTAGNDDVTSFCAAARRRTTTRPASRASAPPSPAQVCGAGDVDVSHGNSAKRRRTPGWWTNRTPEERGERRIAGVLGNVTWWGTPG